MFDYEACRKWEARARAEEVERGAVVATISESCPTCWRPLPDPGNVHRESHTKGVELCQCPGIWSKTRDQLAEAHELSPKMSDLVPDDDWTRSD